jgi:hypothetical protein
MAAEIVKVTFNTVAMSDDEDMGDDGAAVSARKCVRSCVCVCVLSGCDLGFVLI